MKKRERSSGMPDWRWLAWGKLQVGKLTKKWDILFYCLGVFIWGSLLCLRLEWNKN